MTDRTSTAIRTGSGTATLVAMAMAGLMMVFAAGLAHSAALHDAAHDVRHATGFPCH